MMDIANLEAQADALARNRDFPGARALLAQVVQADPGNFGAWMKLAAMANAMGDAQSALNAADGALAAQPLDFMALMMRAMQAKLMAAHWRKPLMRRRRNCSR
jgi:thioredoxin-like negative regulator of GroEL